MNISRNLRKGLIPGLVTASRRLVSKQPDSASSHGTVVAASKRSGLLLVLGLLAAGTPGFAQLSVVNVFDDTGWSSWTVGSTGAVMQDVLGDQQTGQVLDDFVGNSTHFGMQQKVGVVNGNDSVVFRFRMRKFGGNDTTDGNGSNFGVGWDLDNSGTIDLVSVVEVKAGTAALSFGTPGTGANTGPSSTSWAITSTPIALTGYYGTAGTNATYNVKATPTNEFSSTGSDSNDAWVTYAVSFTQLTAAVTTYAKGTWTGYVFDENQIISYLAYTSTQVNSLNQDLFGVNGGTSSTLSWGELGAITPPQGVSGAVPVPEAATFVQLGSLFGLALGWRFWVRRRKRLLGSDLTAAQHTMARSGAG